MKNCLMIMLSSLIFLAGCASSPMYSAANGSQTGYSESDLGEDRFRVEFTGPSSATDEEVKDFALLRAAELTLLNDRDWFQVVSRDFESETVNKTAGISVTQTQAVTHGSCGLLGCTTTTTPVYTGVRTSAIRDRERTTSSLEIVMGSGNATEPTAAYDAKELAIHLKDKHASKT